MKKAFKITFIYLGVLLFALIAAIIFCAGFLFFYRDGNIFGFEYISVNTTMYAQTQKDMSGIEGIIINSETFDVNVKINNNVDVLVGAMKVDVFGYTKTSKTHTGFDLSYDEKNKIATFNADQPSGWLNKNGSYVEIAIPKDLAESGLNLQINTSKGKVEIGSKDDLILNNLDIKTSKSKVLVSNIELKSNVNVDIGSGTIKLDKECSTTSAVNSTIKLGSGKVYFGEIDIEKFHFGTIEIKSIKQGLIQIIKADKLYTNGNINGGGKIQVIDIGVVDFSSLDTDLEIKEIAGDVVSRIVSTGFGSVGVKNSNIDLIINAFNGDIYVGTVGGSATLSTNKGNIVMDRAIKLVSATSISGNISVTYDEENAQNYSSVNPQNRAIQATTENGHISIKGLQNGQITATGKGTISLEYNKVLGSNRIVSNTGNVNIVVPCPTRENYTNEYAFNLTVESKRNTDLKVGVIGSLGDVDYMVNNNQSGRQEFENIFGNTSSNILKVETQTGIIKVRSKNLIGY